MKNIEKTADLLPKTSKMLQIRLSNATMIHYAWQNRGLSRRMRGIMAWQGKMSVEEEKWRVATKDYGRKNTLRHECPNTYHGQDNWPTENKKNESFRGFSFVLSSICIIFAETFWETGDTSALYINYICIYCWYVLGQKMTTGRRGWQLPLSQHVTATGRVDGIPRKSGMTGYGQYLPWPG